MRNWADIVPENVAREQVRWERARAAYQMRQAGLTWKEIACRLDLSLDWAKASYFRWRNGKYGFLSPVEEYQTATEFGSTAEARRFINQKPKIPTQREINLLEAQVSRIRACVARLN